MRRSPVYKLLRIAAVTLTLCMMCTALSACSISFGSDGGEPTEGRVYETLSGMGYDSSPDYTPVVSRYAYAQLSDRQQRLYDLLLENIYDISPEMDEGLGDYPMPSVRVPGRLTTADIRVAIRALTDDNPYIFWCSHSFSHLWDPDENYTEVLAYSALAPDKVASMAAEADEAIDAFYAGVPAGLDEYEREKYVHDFITDTVVYDEVAAGMTGTDERSIRAHSIYGALVDKSAVCEGYGTAVQLLLNGLGVECVSVTGTAYLSADGQDKDDEILHLWNAVRLDGDWYYMDATWDDQEDVRQRYDYFNISYDLLAEDHTLCVTPDKLSEEEIDEGGTEDLNIFIPECTKTDYNYYVYECAHLTDWDGGEVKEALYQAALNMEDCFCFYIDPAFIDYDDGIYGLFKGTPQHFFDYIADVNYRLADHEIDNSNMTFYKDSKRRSVFVDLSYY